MYINEDEDEYDEQENTDIANKEDEVLITMKKIKVPLKK